LDWHCKDIYTASSNIKCWPLAFLRCETILFLNLLAIGRLIFIHAIAADYNVESMSTKQWFALLIFWFIYLIVARPNVS
jgi:hypothetical protein